MRILLHPVSYMMLWAGVISCLCFISTARFAYSSQQTYPVRSWKGLEFLYQPVKSNKKERQYRVYRAVGDRWEPYGYIHIHSGKHNTKHGFLQKIWFNGHKKHSRPVDLFSTFDVYRPGWDK